MSENKKLSSQVDTLRTALILADVPLPAGFETSPQLAQPPPLNPEMPASVSFRTDNLNHQRLHVDWPTQPYQQPAPTPAPQWPTVGLAPSASYSRQGGNSSVKPLPILPKGMRKIKPKRVSHLMLWRHFAVSSRFQFYIRKPSSRNGLKDIGYGGGSHRLRPCSRTYLHASYTPSSRSTI